MRTILTLSLFALTACTGPVPATWNNSRDHVATGAMAHAMLIGHRAKQASDRNPAAKPALSSVSAKPPAKAPARPAPDRKPPATAPSRPAR